MCGPRNGCAPPSTGTPVVGSRGLSGFRDRRWRVSVVCPSGLKACGQGRLPHRDLPWQRAPGRPMPQARAGDCPPRRCGDARLGEQARSTRRLDESSHKLPRETFPHSSPVARVAGVELAGPREAAGPGDGGMRTRAWPRPVAPPGRCAKDQRGEERRGPGCRASPHGRVRIGAPWHHDGRSGADLRPHRAARADVRCAGGTPDAPRSVHVGALAPIRPKPEARLPKPRSTGCRMGRLTAQRAQARADQSFHVFEHGDFLQGLAGFSQPPDDFRPQEVATVPVALELEP